jgi:hypothetical protein
MSQMIFGVHECVATEYLRTLFGWLTVNGCENLGSSFQMLLAVTQAINSRRSTADWTALWLFS